MVAFGRSPFDREIIALAVPALGALAADPLVSLIDTAFVGRLGTTELASLSVAVAVFGVFFAVFNFLAYGTTPLLGRALGNSDGAGAGRIAGSAMAMAVGLGVVFAVLMAGFAEPLLRLLGSGADLIEPAGGYLRIRSLALPAVLIVLVGNGVFRGAQDTRTPLGITIGLNVVNLILDPILIFGLDMGLNGAAWATVVAQWVGAGWFALELRRSAGHMGIAWQRPSIATVRELARTGGVLVLRTAGLLMALTAATSVAARIGDSDVAAHQIGVQLFFFLALTLDAIAVAAMAMLGRTTGEVETTGEVSLLYRQADRLVVMGLYAGVGLAAALTVLSGILPRWFTSERDVLANVSQIYPQLVLLQVVGGLVFAWDGIVIGVTAFVHAMLATVIPSIITTAVLVVIAVEGGQLGDVWWALVLLLVLRATYLAWWHVTRLGRGLVAV